MQTHPCTRPCSRAASPLSTKGQINLFIAITLVCGVALHWGFAVGEAKGPSLVSHGQDGGTTISV